MKCVALPRRDRVASIWFGAAGKADAASGEPTYHNPAKGLYLAGMVNQIAAPGSPIRVMMQILNTIR